MATTQLVTEKEFRIDPIPPGTELAVVPPKGGAAARTPLLAERTDFLEGDAPAAARSRRSWPRPWPPPAATLRPRPGRWCPGSATSCCPTTRSKPTAATSPTSCATCRPRASTRSTSPPTTSSSTSGPCSKPASSPATVARRLSVLRGTYKQLAAKGLVSWETAQDIAAIKAPGVQKNSTPSLTQRQAIALLEAIPTDTLQGQRDLALMSVFFLTGCRVSAITAACVGHLETDGVEHYLNVTEKRNKKRRKLLLDAARPLLAYVERGRHQADDKEGPLFRPLTPNGSGFERRHLDRKTPWRLVKKYCEAAGIDPDRLGQRGIGIHSLRKTAINDAIRNGAAMHEVREFAGHSDIRTTEIYFIRKEEDGEVAARKIQIRMTGRKSEATRAAAEGASHDTPI